MARSKLDPGLKYVHASMDKWELQTQFTCFADEAARNRVNILLESEVDWQESQALQEALKNAEFRVHAWARTVVSGDLPVANVPTLEKLPGLRRVEASRPLCSALDNALPESKVPVPQEATGGRMQQAMRHRGDGVIVGIIDSGIDITHRSFRNDDGSSRILAIWDQGLTPVAGERSPDGYKYGVVYCQNEINDSLLPHPKATVRHQDSPPYHGTHVSGIAAGNGNPSKVSDGVVRYVGMAPSADLVVVANTRSQDRNPGTLGDSADTFDAIKFIVDFAAKAGKPVVINHSYSDNIGPHDGSSLLEVGIDQLMTGPGKVMVESAGNERNRGHHAEGNLKDVQQPHRVEMDVPPGFTDLMVDIWYEHNNRLELRIVSPAGGAHGFGPGVDRPPVTFSNGNIAFVFTDEDDAANHDNRISVVLRGERGSIAPGKWVFELKGTGSWHGWIQRGSPATFVTFVSPAVTISIPGTAKSVISVGAYVNEGEMALGRAGKLADFSSCGPTRDGRRAPTLTAPGDEITSTLPLPADFGPMKGTSMSAPLVAGAAALMLQINKTLTARQVRDFLCRTARLDDQTGSKTSDQWGAGKLDVQAACKEADASVRPSSVRSRRARPVGAGASTTIRASR
jgi:subtilisin family serine protease